MDWKTSKDLRTKTENERMIGSQKPDVLNRQTRGKGGKNKGGTKHELEGPKRGKMELGKLGGRGDTQCTLARKEAEKDLQHTPRTEKALLPYPHVIPTKEKNKVQGVSVTARWGGG